MITWLDIQFLECSFLFSMSGIIVSLSSNLHCCQWEVSYQSDSFSFISKLHLAKCWIFSLISDLRNFTRRFWAFCAAWNLICSHLFLKMQTFLHLELSCIVSLIFFSFCAFCLKDLLLFIRSPRPTCYESYLVLIICIYLCICFWF